jgi:hypothetical protein
VIEERHLIAGLDALSRAHTGDYFADGHRGGAILAACFFCREVDVEEGVSELLASRIDREYGALPLCASRPLEAAQPERIDDVAGALASSLGPLRDVGHNVILGSLALKALNAAPEAATPSRIDGIARLIERFESPEVPSDGSEVPDLENVESVASFVLRELPACMTAFVGRGQGWSGHLLTFGRAMIDLRELGHDELAGANGGFKAYVRRVRCGPQETDGRHDEHPRRPAEPHQRDYWERVRRKPLGLGHVIKYPYAAYGLMARCPDETLINRFRNDAYRIF